MSELYPLTEAYLEYSRWYSRVFIAYQPCTKYKMNRQSLIRLTLIQHKYKNEINRLIYLKMETD